mmetsp:Transcript_703/g.1257  ORF Transcript_703/g.1257 Transcript_703/m.1257 type:complete len:190 (+) Transcript_703:58-627(+)
MRLPASSAACQMGQGVNDECLLSTSQPLRRKLEFREPQWQDSLVEALAPQLKRLRLDAVQGQPPCVGYLPDDDHMVDIMSSVLAAPSTPPRSERGLLADAASMDAQGPEDSSMVELGSHIPQSARSPPLTSSPMATSPCQDDRPSDDIEGVADPGRAWRMQIQERAKEELRRYRMALRCCETGVAIRPC